MRHLSVSVAIVVLSVPCLAGATTTFTGVGTLGSTSQVFGVSADGSTVVGSSGGRGFRWTASSGIVDLGTLPGGATSTAAGVSADGSVITGRSGSSSGNQAYRWTSATGMVGLGDLPGGTFSSGGDGVSADGSVIAGFGTSASGVEAFRWTSATGLVGLGDLPGGIFNSGPNDISADGSVIVGNSFSASATPAACGGDCNEGFLWTAATGMIGLGDLPGGVFRSFANGVSADGTTVVGTGSGGATQAFRWTAAGGMVGLGGFLGSNGGSEGRGVSGDGSIVVGQGTNIGAEAEAAIWTQSSGLVRLGDVLTLQYGVDLTGWDLIAATVISADGRVIGGRGRNPSGFEEGWVVTNDEPFAPVQPPIPEPGTGSLVGLGLVILARAVRRSS